MKLRTSLPFAAACVAAAVAAPLAAHAAEVNHQAIADVAAGRATVARASWWGFDAVDSTAALQAAIDSGVPTLVVDKASGPWIVRPMRLRSDQEIRFEAGVEVVAKRGDFKGLSDSLFTAMGCENLVLSGSGATLRMWRSDYAAAPYAKAEWRHVVSLRGCRAVKILGLTLSESGGDGIYLGNGKAGETNRDILIKDVVCDRNHRQGISVISAENLLIEGTVLRNTAGTAPQAGIDFEPNRPGERLVNCVLRDCVSENNAGAGYLAHLTQFDATSAAVSLRLENCKAAENGSAGIAITTGNEPARAVQGAAEFIRCTVQGGRGPAFSLRGNPATAMRVRFEDCAFLDVAPAAAGTSPIMFAVERDATQDPGGVRFADCLIRDPHGRTPIGFVDDSGGLRLAGVTGTLILETPAAKTPVALTPETLARWIPATAFKRYPRVKLAPLALEPLNPSPAAEAAAFGPLRLRGTNQFVFYARQGDAVALRFHHGKMSDHTGRPCAVTVADRAGTPVATGSIGVGQDGDAQFAAPATGVYRVKAAAGGNWASIAASSHPLLLNADDERIHVVGSGGRFFFHVPAGTREFGIRLWGSSAAEAVKATLFDAAGRQVDQKDDITGVRQFEVTLPEPSRGETWSLETTRPAHGSLEDYFLDLVGIPPLLAPTAETVLVGER